MLGLSNKYLGFMRVTKNTRYRRYKLPKPGGGSRVVYEADEPLRTVQYLILQKELNKIELPDYLYAFEKGRNAREMAEMHVQKSFVLSYDLKDFFGSIKQRLIKEIFCRYFPEEKAVLLSELVCFHNFVPQGTVTAPKVANIVVASTFGPELVEYFKTLNATFTVYADDLTVSFTRLLSPTEVKDITKMIVDTLYKYRLRLNHGKTKVMPFMTRQYVLGATVNVKVNLPRERRDRLKAAVHGLRVRGVEAEAQRFNVTPGELLANIQGRINWYRQLNPERGGRLYEQFQEIKKTLD